MQRDGRAGTRQSVNLACIAEFLLNRRRSRRLDELSEAGPSIGEPPRRQFDPELVKGLNRFSVVFFGHRPPVFTILERLRAMQFRSLSQLHANRLNTAGGQCGDEFVSIYAHLPRLGSYRLW